jgi:hypothetical protein
LTELHCNDDINPGIIRQSQISLLAKAGITYIIQVAEWKGGGPNGGVPTGGDMVLNVAIQVDEVPKELEVWLMDDALKITQNLRETNQYAVTGSENPKQLKLVVGKHDFVGEKLADAQAIPTTYELSQSFPNPFNPATTIRYGLPQASRVTLKIYNLLGAEVATLVENEQKAAGYHTTIWDGRNAAGKGVASGVYFIRLRAGPSASSGQAFVQTRKMLLLE